MNNSLNLYKFKSKLGSSTWRERIKLAFNFRIFHPDIIQEILAHLFNIRVVTNNFSVWAVFEQTKGDNYVDAGATSNDIVSWSISSPEIDNYSAAITKFLRKVEPYLEDSIFVRSNLSEYLWSAAHHSGTCSIGDRIGIVDSDLKLKGVTNAFVCDGSVIPEHSYANTGLTIAKLALRLCDSLKRGV
jgi:choline dehydrogenase-like flavoprotein